MGRESRLARVGLSGAVAVGFQLLLLLIGALRGPVPDPWGVGPVLAHVLRWDGGYYMHIATSVYGPGSPPELTAFYPLVPLLAAAGGLLGGGSAAAITIAALVLNTLATAAALLGLLSVARLLGLGRRARVLAVAGLMAFPAAFFLHPFYTEALFLAGSLWAYRFALTRNWVAAVALVAALSATRLTFLLVVGLIGLEYLRSHSWRVGTALRDRRALLFLAAPLGFVAYCILLLARRGDFFAFLHAYSTGAWSYHRFDPNILQTLATYVAKSAVCVARGFRDCPNQFAPAIDAGPYISIFDAGVGYLLPLAALALLAATSLIALLRYRGIWVPLGWFGLAALVFFTLNGNVISVHRYVLPVFVIYLVASSFAARRRWSTVIAIVLLLIGGAVQMLLYSGFAEGRFAG